MRLYTEFASFSKYFLCRNNCLVWLEFFFFFYKEILCCIQQHGHSERVQRLLPCVLYSFPYHQRRRHEVDLCPKYEAEPMFLLQTQISLWFRQRERRANLHPGTDDPEKRQITLVPGYQTNR